MSYSLTILEVFSSQGLSAERVSEKKEGFQNVHGPTFITWPVSCQVKCGPVILEELKEGGESCGPSSILHVDFIA